MAINYYAASSYGSYYGSSPSSTTIAYLAASWGLLSAVPAQLGGAGGQQFMNLFLLL